MKIFSFARRTLRRTLFFFALSLVSGLLGVVAYFSLLPYLAAWPKTARISWPGLPANGPTVIERTEQVVLSSEEGLERFSAAPRTAVVRVVSFPTERTSRLTDDSSLLRWSGLLVTNDGFVAVYVNDVPVSVNRRFSVFFSDGNVSQARYVAYDSVTNIAYFRTERADTPTVAFANSADIRPGRRFMVLAGTDDAAEGKLASGYIGERARTFNLSGKTVASTDEWEGVFFPDRPIDPAFSGGAAVAMNGELIGLIGTLSLDTDEYSFILPAAVLRESLQRVISNQIPIQASVGAYYRTLTKETSLLLGVSRDRGALIFTPSKNPALAVISGSPAERSGLRYGDIVTAVNGREINLDWPLSVALYEVGAGERVVLSVERSGNEIELSFVR